MLNDAGDAQPARQPGLAVDLASSQKQGACCLVTPAAETCLAHRQHTMATVMPDDCYRQNPTSLESLASLSTASLLASSSAWYTRLFCLAPYVPGLLQIARRLLQVKL